MITRIEARVQGTLTQVECYSNTTRTLTFWVATAQLDEHGHVPSHILRSRVRHATQENLGHFSYITLLSKKP